MTQLSSICKALLAGETLSIMDGFQKFSCTNLPREISRSVEKKFGATISKLPIKFKSQYGHSGVYYQYRLNPRILGYGLVIKNTNAYPLSFSERMGLTKTYKIKNWSISTLTPF